MEEQQNQISQLNVQGTNYSFGGTGALAECHTAADAGVKTITLAQGCTLIPGMFVSIEFEFANDYGFNTPVIIYSSDGSNFFSDEEMSTPFTLEPVYNRKIVYTGEGSAYEYTTHPVVNIGGYSNIPVCDGRGRFAYGRAWEDGDDIMFFFTGTKLKLHSYAIADDRESIGTAWSSEKVSNVINDTVEAITPEDIGAQPSGDYANGNNAMSYRGIRESGTVSTFLSAIANKNKTSSPATFGSVLLTDGPQGSGNYWYNYLYIPHRAGIGSDSYLYGTLILMLMTINNNKLWLNHYITGNWQGWQAV